LAHGKALSQALQLIAAMAKEEPTMKLELARRRIRQVLGYRSPIYRLAAELFNRYEILRREGWRTLWQIEKASHASGPEITLNLRSLRHPIAVRPGTEDVPALINNAIREEYGQLPADFKPAVIVDAGAYIGDTSAYFLSRFPASRIIALEPNTDSFPLASRNLEPYGKQVSLLPAALWSETTTVCFAGSQTGAAISASGSEVPTITMPALMEEFGLDFIDLLKLDIEGAEAQVIPTGLGGWLEKVGMILLETHGADIEAAVIPLLCQSGFSCRQMRNVWYCKRTGGPVLEC
jgi:FkbM family methyltransferase